MDLKEILNLLVRRIEVLIVIFLVEAKYDRLNS